MHYLAKDNLKIFNIIYLKYLVILICISCKKKLKLTIVTIILNHNHLSKNIFCRLKIKNIKLQSLNMRSHIMFYVSKLLKKNKKYTFISILLILIIIFLSFIIKKSLIMFDTPSHPLIQHDICTHRGNDVTINVYSKTGQLKFKLTAHCIQHFSNQKITWFICPSIIAFDNKNIPTWKIIANQAKLSCEKTLHLYGYIYINNLIHDGYLQSIITNQATINLITQDIISNEKVIIHGHYFYSVGMKMHANLHTQTAKLINSAQTYYEIQHIR